MERRRPPRCAGIWCSWSRCVLVLRNLSRRGLWESVDSRFMVLGNRQITDVMVPSTGTWGCRSAKRKMSNCWNISVLPDSCTCGVECLRARQRDSAQKPCECVLCGSGEIRPFDWFVAPRVFLDTRVGGCDTVGTASPSKFIIIIIRSTTIFHGHLASEGFCCLSFEVGSTGWLRSPQLSRFPS